MNLYVVLSRGMRHGKDAVAVFTTKELAESFIKTLTWQSEVGLYPVIGNLQENPSKVFAAHRYLRDEDEHFFIGLFWDFQEAKNESGEHGIVTQKEINSK